MRHMNKESLTEWIHMALFIGAVQSPSIALLNIFIHSIPYLKTVGSPMQDAFNI